MTVAQIHVEDLHLHFPVHNSSSRSLQLDVFRRLGGRLAVQHRAVVVEALSGIDLELGDGARVALVGDNGAGKTTLLRALAGVYPPTRGKVEIEGRVIPFTDMRMGMDPEATGYENIIFRSIFLGMTFAEARERTKEIAAFSELGEFLSMPVRTYSQGMAMRLAFSISTSVDPEIMVMDEMIGAGDQTFVAKARQRVDELMRKARILVIASHNVAILKKLCTTGLWLEQGRTRMLGPIDEVIAAYTAAGKEAARRNA